MRVVMLIKDPDAVYEAVRDAIDAGLGGIVQAALSRSELDTIREARRGAVEEKLKRWVGDGEYLTVEFDLDAMTAVVVENSR